MSSPLPDSSDLLAAIFNLKARYEKAKDENRRLKQRVRELNATNRELRRRLSPNGPAKDSIRALRRAA